VRITGERPVDGVTPDGLVALHAAGYREAAVRMGPGTVLDIGCGVGFGASNLFAHGRTVVGIDYDSEAVALAHKRWVNDLRVAQMDGARLGFRDGSFDWVCSSHIIEHFVDPSAHVAEIARVLKPTGTAFIFTPNAPADLENPFHVSLFDLASLDALLRRYFDEVWVGAHDCVDHVKRDFATRRAAARRLLALDVFGVRHRMPRSWYIASYAAATRLLYRSQARRHAGGATRITVDDFFATDKVDQTTLSLFAVVRNR
jgi:2-polyprenyl-3-methyl-5-hydroxy-6-metoxy-1,4-benzoquinol methylase